MRAVIEIEQGETVTPFVLGAKSDWAPVAEAIRRALAENLEAGRCGSITVSVHFANARCDHEVG